jgi:hypothetical protein
MRWLASWVLLGIGHATSKLPGGWWYPFYNKVMGWSSQVQGKGPGPWKDAPKDG